MKNKLLALAAFLVLIMAGCKTKDMDTIKFDNQTKKYIEQQYGNYFHYTLKSDISHLSDNQKQMLGYLFQVADIMDTLYWMQAAGPYADLYKQFDYDLAKKFFIINYGPWNRLDGNRSFVPGVGEKPKGAFFYPEDMTVDEFENLDDTTKTSLYTVIVRDENGDLSVVPYHIHYKEYLEKAAGLMRKAADLAEDKDFATYLKLRADALLTDDYFSSDTAWMSMKNNDIEFVVGPIENYEDELFGYKAAYESYILIKDKTWSERLQKYAALLPDLQKKLPVAEQYKQESPGTNSDLNAYDAVYYAGDCNAGSKTIAINLPNDERVQLLKGSRRLQLKNAMQAKFENILVPISNVLIDPQQRKYVTFDAFFANTMFHEVAHGLGIKNTINGQGPVRTALSNYYSTLEEGKADILGLWLVEELTDMNEFETDIMSNYVTFVASIFRSIRFGASSSHAKANLIRYNFFMEHGAIVRNADGTYTINPDKLKQATENLAQIIIKIQGDGDIEAARELFDRYLIVTDDLKKDLSRLEEAGIPVDVVWEQGPQVLGLK